MLFLADMGISLAVCDWLRNAGHEVSHLSQEGLQRLPNGDIFIKAEREGRVLLTCDLDFGEIVAASGARQPSVIVFRLRNMRYRHVCQRLETVLATSSADLQQGVLIVVEEGRHRVRKLPIER